MRLDSITATPVRHALRAIRYGKPLGDSPLLNMRIVATRLRREGMESNAQSRAWALGGCLQEIIWQHLECLRGASTTVGRNELTPESELALIRADFRADSIEREAWSLLDFRYFSKGRRPVRVVAEALGVPERTLHRRVERGHAALAEALRELEHGKVEESSARHNLPHALTRFIGREREIGEVRGLLGEHRLVTLTGPGGIGKSRLSVEVALAVSEAYGDGVWLAQLGQLDDSQHIVRSVAAVLGVGEEPRTELLETVLAHLRPKRMLLLLDNCEHLAEACARFAGALLTNCRNVQVLATSRTVLGAEGEAAWQVPAMAVPKAGREQPAVGIMHFDAVRLFADRAAAAAPGFALTDENLVRVANICRQLDGWPLAIELACPRLRALSLAQLEERLVDRLGMLRDGRRPTRPQHESMRASLDWSHEALSDAEKQMLGRLSVFRSGWTLEAAEAVCPGDGIDESAVQQLVEQLVAKSMVSVQRGGDGLRFLMLAMVRQYATTKLEAGGRAELVRDRHLEWFLAMAEKAEPKLLGPEQVAWLRRLAGEHPDIRAALQWARDSGNSEKGLRLGAAFSWFWLVRGHWGEGREELRMLLAIDGTTGNADARSRALHAAATLAFSAGDHDAARAQLEECLAIRRRRGDEAGVAESLNLLGNVAHAQGDYDTARAQHSESLAIQRESGDMHGVAASLSGLGNDAWAQCDYEAARELYEESLAINRQLGNPRGIAGALNNLSNVAYHQGDHDVERELLEESLVIKRQLGDKRGIAVALNNLGTSAYDQGDYRQARELYEESLAVSRQVGDKETIADALGNAGLVAAGLGDYERAQALYEESLAIRRELGDQDGIGAELGNLGLVAHCQGNHETAKALHEQSLAINRQLGDKRGIAIALTNLGLAATGQGEYETAKMLHEQSLAISRELGVRRWTANTLNSLGDLAGNQGDHEVAWTLNVESLTIRSQLGDKLASAESLESLAQHAASVSKLRCAARLLGAARAIREALAVPLPPATRSEIGAAIATARTDLGPTAFDAAYAEGRALTMDEAVAYARGEVTWDELAPVVAEWLETDGGLLRAASEPATDRPERGGEA